MQEPKWTPGPWEIRMSRERRADVRGWREVWAGRTPVVDADGATITRAGDSWCEHGVRLNEANARLIAAAPELYDVLGLAQEALLQGNHNLSDRMITALNAIRAVMARVHGESDGN